MTRGRAVMLGVLAAAGVAVIAGGGWVGWGLWRLSKDPMGVAGGVRLLYRVDVDSAWEPARNRKELVGRTADAVRRRLAPYSRYAVVGARGAQIEVLLPAAGQKLPVDILKQQIARSGRLQFKLVDDGSAYMRTLAEKVRGAAPPGVTVATESWTESSGAEHEDVFLAAERKDQLFAAIQAAIADDPIPVGHEILFERRESDWRSYYLFWQVHLDNADVTSADQGWAQEDGRPYVAIELAPGGATKLSDLTGRSVGRKLAIVFENLVVSAPVIEARIPGFRVRISLGQVADPFQLQQEAKDLVAVLRVQPLAAPIVLESEDAVAARRD